MKVSIDVPTGIGFPVGGSHEFSGSVTWDVADPREPRPYLVKLGLSGPGDSFQMTQGYVGGSNVSPLPWSTATFNVKALGFPAPGAYTATVRVLDADFGTVARATRDYTAASTPWP
jgi:hypothetical protein